ncbi:hypothetical protein FIE12Z_11654 [Fusarium flagelliforme]|uniref:Uncharacterized protein n=1 Tax=Fusarium flagelliforme TaxID=2675880 RepID=A0A395M8D0_9HYPO|nr:hypothetical protein FIE12Z_11654 [Fusarium flagelliforme]
MVTLYRSHQCQKSRVEGLKAYGDALVATRKTIVDPKEPIMMKMQVVSVMFVCHYWIDRKSVEQHREIISVLFREAVLKNQLDDLEPYMLGLTQLAVLASFLNPRFELGSWFWEACETIGTPRPVKYHQGSFISLESGTLAQISIFMRSPKRHLHELRCIYDVIKFEMPKIQKLTALATMAAAAPTAEAMSIRVCSSYRFAYAILLSMKAVISHTLQIWDADLTLLGELHDCIDESISLAKQCESARPYGAAFVPDFLTMVYAAATDGYRNDEMVEILLDYEKDCVGADFLGHALSIRERLYAMERLAMGGSGKLGAVELGVLCNIVEPDEETRQLFYLIQSDPRSLAFHLSIIIHMLDTVDIHLVAGCVYQVSLSSWWFSSYVAALNM